MKDKVFTLIIGILTGAIITAAGFLLFGNKGRGNFDPSKMKDGEFTPPTEFSEDFKNKDFKDLKDKNFDLNSIDTNNIDLDKLPQRPDKE